MSSDKQNPGVGKEAYPLTIERDWFVDTSVIRTLQSQYFWNKPLKLQKAFLLIVLLETYETYHGAGGMLHTTLDDGNIRDTDIQSNLEHAKTHNDYWGTQIATLLLDFDEEEREVILNQPWNITTQIQ